MPLSQQQDLLKGIHALAKSQIELVLRLMALPFPLTARAIKLLKSFVGDVVKREPP